MQKKTFQSVTHSDDLAEDLCNFEKLKQGAIRDIHFRYSAVKGYESSLERVIISIEDIAEHKTAEKVIFNSQQRIKSLINTIDGIVCEYDIKTFYCSFISEKVEKILEYTREEWLESKTFWGDHIYPEHLEY